MPAHKKQPKRKVQSQDVYQVLSMSQKDEIKKAFDFFDTTGTGVIDVSNLKVVFRALGVNVSKEETLQLVAQFSSGEESQTVENAKIDFQEFLEIILFKIVEPETAEDIKNSFASFEDVEKRGSKGTETASYITKKSLLREIRKFDPDVTEEEAEELIIRAVNKNFLLKINEMTPESQDESPNFDSPEYFVTLQQFMKVMKDENSEAF